MRDEREMKDSGIDWIAYIPNNWKVNVLFQVTSQVKNKNLELKEQNLLSLSYGKIKRKDINTNEGLLPASFENYNIVEKDDIVLRLTDLQNDHKSLRVGHVNERGIITSAYVTLHPNVFINSNYLYYVLHMFDLKKGFYGMGAGVRQGLTYDEVKTLKICYPSMLEQQAIANYLDDRCSKIDTIIAEAKASIEEYKELKQAVIYEAVTKGLDKTIEMKHYNDWFDKCPSNWEYKQIRYLYELRDERNFEPLSEVNLISLYTDQGVIQHADIEKTSGNKAVTADGYKKVYPEDIVVNIILCWMGAMGRSEYQGVTSPAYDVYKPIGGSKVCSRYYHYLFRTDRFSKKCYTVGRGIMMMRWRTYSSQFRAIKVPVPPYNEQIEIANYLDKRISHMEELINAKKYLIEDLEAYKKSLIYEVVTGKRKVVA